MSRMANDAVSLRLIRGVARVVAASLIVSSVGVPVYGQVARTGGPSGAQHLIINILEGEGALNNIRQRDAREPVVQVTDENHKPVAGVALLFLIHSGKGGATASFGTNSLTFSTTTNAQGIAHAGGLQLGTHAGSFTISVTATVGTMVVATAVIHMSNMIGAVSSAAASSSAGTSASTSAGTSTTASSTGGATTGGATTGGTAAGGTAAGGTAAGGTGSSVGTAAAHHGLLHLLSPKFLIGGVVVAGAVVGIVVATKSSGSTDITLGGTTVGHP